MKARSIPARAGSYIRALLRALVPSNEVRRPYVGAIIVVCTYAVDRPVLTPAVVTHVVSDITVIARTLTTANARATRYAYAATPTYQCWSWPGIGTHQKF